MFVRNLLLFLLLLSAEISLSQDLQLIQRLKAEVKTEQGENRVNVLNDLVDELLRPKPTKKNSSIAKPYAIEAAEISEELNYNLGMVRSFEQLAVIYKTLDKLLPQLKWERKASRVPRGPLLKEQQEELDRRREELSEMVTTIEDQTLELLEQESELDITEQKVEQLSMDKKVVLLENTLLQKESRIQDAEVREQQLKSRFLIAVLGIFLVIVAVLFFLFRSRNKLAKELVQKNRTIKTEINRSDGLLLNILPSEIADELKSTGKAEPKNHKAVSIMFTDFKDFTLVAEKLTPKELVNEIDYCFGAFDEVVAKFGIEKIKTIGDAYLCAYGINNTDQKDHSVIIRAAKEILSFMNDYQKEREAQGRLGFSIRIGIHTGPIVAGVVGKRKFAYDIWGDAVNTAARMEQSSEEGKINISADTYELVKNEFKFEYRGKILAKNKGKIDMYFLDNEAESLDAKI